MARNPPQPLSRPPQHAETASSVPSQKSCLVNGTAKKTSQGTRWWAIALAGLLSFLQFRAVQWGQDHAHAAHPVHPILADLVPPHRPGPASETTVEARRRAHWIDTIARARAAESLQDGEAARQAWSRVFVHADDPQLRTLARDALIRHAEASWPEGFRSRFLTSLSPGVLEASRAHRVLPSITLAQAILESGWGRSYLTTRYHNLFGVKAGRSSQRIRLASREHVRGRYRPSRQTFRRYESKAQSIRDHAVLLSTDRRYAHARPHWSDRHRFIEAIAPRYASSPTYVEALNELIDLYELDRWDDLIVAAVAADEPDPDAVAAAEPLDPTEDDTDDTGQPPPFEG